VTPGSVARRYAKALYELAVEQGLVTEIAQQLEAVSNAVDQQGEDALAPGALSADARRSIGIALATPFGLGSTFGRFLQLVALRDRLMELPRLRESYVRLMDEAAGRVRAKVVSARTLDESETEAVVAALSRSTGKQVVAEMSADAELLGGVIVELEGRVLDGSIRTRLDRLVARMAGNGG
jgi:F-type H+-transporting ATPase subunit delta